MSDQLPDLAALPLGKEPQYPLERRVGEPQNWSGQHGEEKNLAPAPTWILTPSAVQPITTHYTDLHYPRSQPSIT
jgi:hypothetical protein